MKSLRLSIGRPRSLRAGTFKTLAAGTAVFSASAWVAGCSFLYDLSTSQCSVDADCESIGVGLVCRESLCQEPLFECVTNADCLDSEEFMGGPSACIQNECELLTTTECPQILPQIDEGYLDNLRGTNPLILGAFANTIQNAYGLQTQNYDLAVTEFTRAGVGRPIVMVVCNNLVEDPAEIDTAMTHLTDTLRVPGVVAALTADDLQRAFQTKGDAANMFFISPGDSDSTLLRLQDRGLMWHLLPGGEGIGRSYVPLVERAIGYLQATDMVQTTDTLRIAQVVTPEIRFLRDIAGLIQSDPGTGDTPGGITFNGMSVAENNAALNYLAVNVTSVTYTDPAASYTDAIVDLLEFKPHIVIVNATEEFTDIIGPALEADWETAAPGQARPFYILSPYLYGGQSASNFVATAGVTPSVRQRLIGVNAPAAADREAYNDYVFAMEAEFGQGIGVNAENFYDAASYMLYSTIAAGQLLNSGADLARGMGRLIGGSQTYNVGYRDLPDAAAALQASAAGGITLNGTMGPPNFDINGGRNDAGTVWCYSVGNQLQSDVLTYNSETRDMEGTFPCFTDF